MSAPMPQETSWLRLRSQAPKQVSRLGWQRVEGRIEPRFIECGHQLSGELRARPGERCAGKRRLDRRQHLGAGGHRDAAQEHSEFVVIESVNGPFRGAQLHPVSSRRRQMQVSPGNVLSGEVVRRESEAETPANRPEPDVNRADEKLLAHESGEQDVADPSEPRPGEIDDLSIEHVAPEEQLAMFQRKLTLQAEIGGLDGACWAELDECVFERRHRVPVDERAHPMSRPHHKSTHDGLGVVEVDGEIPEPAQARSIGPMHRLTGLLTQTKHA